MKILGKGRICMKRMIPVLGALLLLTACTPAESVLPAATPAPEPTAVPSPLPAASPTPSPTAVPVEEASLPEITLEEWTSVMPEQKPGYTVTEGPLELLDYVAWPDQPMTLRIASWKGTLAEAVEAFGVPLETLQALNPDPETWTDPGSGAVNYYNLKLRDDYLVPRPDIKEVTISTPWVASRWEQTASYKVPAALSDQAAACMASAYNFEYNHNSMSGGIWPADYDEETGWYTTKEGGLYTTYSDLTRYLEAVYSPAVCEGILGGPVAEEDPDDWHPYYQGENDEIVFQGGDRGSNIRHCGTSFTQPELQPDGSIQFWQLSLTVESDDFVGWGEGITYTPDTASSSIVRLEPSETGWRVASLDLPN